MIKTQINYKIISKEYVIIILINLKMINQNIKTNYKITFKKINIRVIINNI